MKSRYLQKWQGARIWFGAQEEIFGATEGDVDRKWICSMQQNYEVQNMLPATRTLSAVQLVKEHRSMLLFSSKGHSSINIAELRKQVHLVLA